MSDRDIVDIVAECQFGLRITVYPCRWVDLAAYEQWPFKREALSVLACLRDAGYVVVGGKRITEIINQIPRTALCGPEAADALRAIDEIFTKGSNWEGAQR